VKQEGSTRDMIYPADAIIEWVSKGMTLLPGAIIATGTPDGVGFARKPPEFLKPGDVMESEVEGIGRCATGSCQPPAECAERRGRKAVDESSAPPSRVQFRAARSRMNDASWARSFTRIGPPDRESFAEGFRPRL
jgi:hypothetical protein